MRSAYFAFLLSAVAISAASVYVSTSTLQQSEEFQDIVEYLNYNLSPKDIHDLLETIPEAFYVASDESSDEKQTAAMPRSVGSVVANVVDHIPWNKITDYVNKMAKSNSKFSKVLNLVNDQKFRDLVKKAVNSHTLADFVKGVATHGFSWTEFLHLVLHALCSTATTLQHDQYSVGVCKVLQNL